MLFLSLSIPSNSKTLDDRGASASNKKTGSKGTIVCTLDWFYSFITMLFYLLGQKCNEFCFHTRSFKKFQLKIVI